MSSELQGLRLIIESIQVILSASVFSPSDPSLPTLYA